MTREAYADKLAWYINRLRAMSLAEIGHRVLETGKKKLAGRWPAGWSRYQDTGGPLPKLPLSIDLSNTTPEDLERWRVLATDTKDKRFSFLGATWPESERRGIWHLDPVTGREWPKDQYCFDINYRHSAVYGDVKYVWELNRLQYLQPVAALARVTDDETLKSFVFSEIESWIDANPPFLGVNWPSGIELSLRAVSVLTVTRLIGGPAASPGLTRKVRALLAATADWLSRYPSRYSSANNHLISEGLGLYLIGLAMPGHPDSQAWKTNGRKILETEASRQILPDGIGAEQSPTYTSFTLEMLLLAMRCGQEAQEPFPDIFQERLRTASKTLNWFLDEAGHPPRIGDDDEGRVFFDEPSLDEYYVQSVVWAADASLDLNSTSRAISFQHLRNIIFGPVNLTAELPHGVQVFETGGYSVLRDHIQDDEVILFMDHGPLGYLSIAAHGHADALAIWLHRRGQAVLADAGTFLYHSGGLWRDAFRGTRLHNTLSIHEEDSSRISGAFNWSQQAETQLVSACGSVADFAVEAKHNGYAAQFGVWHHRHLKRTGPAAFDIVDWLEPVSAASKPLNVSLGFLAGDGIGIENPEAGRFQFLTGGGRPMLEIQIPLDLSGRVERGNEIEKTGWVSPKFGVKREADQLIISGTVKPDHTLTTRLMFP